MYLGGATKIIIGITVTHLHLSYIDRKLYFTITAHLNKVLKWIVLNKKQKINISV